MALLVNGDYVADREFIEEFLRLQSDASDERASIELLRHTAEERVIQRTLLRQMAVHAGFSVSSEEVEVERRRRCNGNASPLAMTQLRYRTVY